jgi:hypothetical protein
VQPLEARFCGIKHTFCLGSIQVEQKPPLGASHDLTEAGPVHVEWHTAQVRPYSEGECRLHLRMRGGHVHLYEYTREVD